MVWQFRITVTYTSDEWGTKLPRHILLFVCILDIIVFVGVVFVRLISGVYAILALRMRRNDKVLSEAEC